MAKATTATATTQLDRAWKARHEGGPLPARLREGLERALNADLSAVRVHTGPAADGAARAFDADAVASGSALFFRHGAFDPGSRAGLRLLAHEVAHTVQQADATAHARGLSCVSGSEDASESMADRFADAFTAAYTGGPSAMDGSLAALVLPHGRRGHDVLRVAFGPSGVVQLHASFEHRYLGDGNPDDLRIIAENRDKVVRDRLIEGQMMLFELFDRKDPRHVTRDDILRVAPHIQTMEIGADGILATFGEVTALPDYLSHPDQVDTIRGDVLLPILQVIRQESYNEFHALLTGRNPHKRFPLSPFQPTGALWGIVGALRETTALDVLTAGLGVGGQDHYQGLLARNACHFAPYTWYRWLTFHLAARQAAADAYKAGGDTELVHKAWNLAGYADHFLEDSFAAGHLIDKTLVMQWFVDWAADTDLVADQAVLRYMTAALQPGLAAGKLYDASYEGPSHDPQTVQELRTEAERIVGTKLRPRREDGQLPSYLDYLTFLTSAAAQLGTNLLHNHYNDNSLWVASTANPTPYRVWGDGTLLSGRDAGAGAYITASTAQLSRRAVRELITKGGTSITPAEIRAAFPTLVGPSPDNMTTIAQWATGQRPFVEETIFKGFEGEIGKLLSRLSSPRLGIVSRDEALGELFATRTDTERSIVHAESAVLRVGERLFAASRGYVFELDRLSGAPLKGRVHKLPDVVGSTVSSLESNGRMLFIGISAHVHALPLDSPWSEHSGWISQEIGGPANLRSVTLLMERERLFAASHGYVYELDPDTGVKLQEVELGSKIGFGDYPVDLATDGELLYAGTHGYVYAISLRERWYGPLWYSAKLGAGIDHEPVSVLVKDGRLFAVSDGEAYELPRDGSERTIQHIDLKKGRLGPYRASLTTDEGMLYIGTHGAAYALPLRTNWATVPMWATETLTDFGEHGPVSVLHMREGLFVGCGGYVYELDLLDGAIRQRWQLTYLISTIPDMPTEMTQSSSEPHIGVHGYAYGMLLAAIQPTPTSAWPSHRAAERKCRTSAESTRPSTRHLP